MVYKSSLSFFSPIINFSLFWSIPVSSTLQTISMWLLELEFFCPSSGFRFTRRQSEERRIIWARIFLSQHWVLFSTKTEWREKKDQGRKEKREGVSLSSKKKKKKKIKKIKRENLLCLSIFLNKKQALPNTQLYFYLKHTTKHICLIINTENTCCQHFLNYNFYIILNNNTKNLQSKMT